MTAMERNPNRNDSGSVMMEFIIVMPIFLLLFGGTFLLFDLTMARVYLQEGNRNLAWLAEDRFDQGEIGRQLRKVVRRPFDERNAQEGELSLTAGDFWSFGEQVDNELAWGKFIRKFSDGGGTARTSVEAGTKWCGLYSGNMELRMNHVSAVYIGAIAVSDVLHRSSANDPFYAVSYELTRAAGDANGEALLVHRRAAGLERAKISTASLKLSELVMEKWPSGEGLGVATFDAVLVDFKNSQLD